MTPRKVSDLGPLSEAEQLVIAGLDSGTVVVLGDGGVPEAGDERRRVRAGLIRLLLLENDPDPKYRLHEKGLRIRGAWIPDRLDLEGCRDLSDLGLLACRFAHPPMLRSAGLSNLFLSGSHLPGLNANGLETKGNVFLRNADATGAVRMISAALGGYLDCKGAKFRGANGSKGKPEHALSADGLQAKGRVVLSGVRAKGAVRLTGASVGSNLDCAGATFQKEMDEEGNQGKTLSLDGAQIEGTFYLRKGARVEGALDLTGANIGTIVDAADCWPGSGNLLLDRCRYGAFIGGAPVDAAARLDWLARQDPTQWGADFWPQPYEQCAKVLREMGHGEDARAILIEKERLQRAARRARAEPGLRRVLAVWDGVLGATVRYGRQPLWAFAWLGLFLVVGLLMFRSAEAAGAIKPNNPVTLRSPEWVACAGVEGPARIACFFATPAGASYPRFNAFIYSADTLLPIVSLEMQGYWIPDEATDRGWWARGYLWLHIAVGWALSLLAVAGFSGLVKSD